jgi:glycine/D-amino acid oxidase-like deaminating enzyme
MHALVLGGGLGGMLAARLLAARGAAVTILEAGAAPGAGWRSLATPFGPADLGLRVPRESGLGWADALVFHDLPLDWHRLGPCVREAHLFAGRLRAETGCLDARALGPDLLAHARAELIARADTPDPAADAPDLAARFRAIFGPTLLEAALRPACLSLLGTAPERLAPLAAAGRLPGRIVVAEQAETERLLRLGHLGARLAHPRASDAPQAGPDYLYPRRGGIGAWTTALEAALRAAEVAIRTGARVAGLVERGGRVRGARLADGTELGCDLLLLAAPPRALPDLPAVPEHGLPVAAALLAIEGGAPPPRDWLLSYDPATPFLRLGFPDRLEGGAPGGVWRIVAELREPAPIGPVLAALGLLPPGARIRAEIALGTGRFAVETVDSRAAREAALARLASLDGVAVLRSATGGHALIGDLLADAARLAARLDLPQAA